LTYQPPASSTFLSQQISYQQPASSSFLSEQTSTSHQPNEQAAAPLQDWIMTELVVAPSLHAIRLKEKHRAQSFR
jgi:hypothetical protein